MPLPPTIESDLKYCPRCGDEYRAEIATCAACRCDLLSGRQVLAALVRQAGAAAPAANPIRPGEPLVAVRKGPVLQIKQLRDDLLRQGIPALAGTENGVACATGCRGAEVLLQVRESDLPAVMAVLAMEYQQSTGLADHDLSLVGEVYDAGAEEATCPACGCRFATSLTACPDCGLCFA